MDLRLDLPFDSIDKCVFYDKTGAFITVAPYYKLRLGMVITPVDIIQKSTSYSVFCLFGFFLLYVYSFVCLFVIVLPYEAGNCPLKTGEELYWNFGGYQFEFVNMFNRIAIFIILILFTHEHGR